MNLASIRKQLEALENAPIREQKTISDIDIAIYLTGLHWRRKNMGDSRFNIPPLSANETRALEILDNARARKTGADLL